MTAEIGVLNTAAVALAADSAVTISREGNNKIYNSANKLFMLSKYNPVGIMLYGTATFMDIPWETIIKTYRKNLGAKSFPTIKEYAKDFIEALENNNKIISPAEEESYCKFNISFYFRNLMKSMAEHIGEKFKKNKSLTTEEVEAIVKDFISNEHKGWDGVPFLESVGNKDKRNFISKYQDHIKQEIKNIFQKFPVDEKSMKDIAMGLFFRKRFPYGSSGIVIAGFGENERFPSLMAFNIGCKVQDKLQYEEKISEAISIDNTASIIPFAQSEMVHTFMSGIDPNLEKFSTAYLESIFVNLPNKISSALTNISEEDKKSTQKSLESISKDLFEDYNNRIRYYKSTKHISSIIDIVGILPKDELAAMAEALVNLTSFKRKVSRDAETVGGPIDVAVISKGDGFVWIKRKHYFKPELNHHFFSNYYK